MIKEFINYFEYIDIFGLKANFYVEPDRTNYKTSIGSLITLVIYIVIAISGYK
jgi:hypothetical protein